MHNSLEVLLDSLIRNRIESLYGELIKNNSSYNQFTSERNLYFTQLHEGVPENIQKTLFLYDDADLSLRAILEREIYLQGFKDALHLHNELHISLDWEPFGSFFHTILLYNPSSIYEHERLKGISLAGLSPVYASSKGFSATRQLDESTSSKLLRDPVFLFKYLSFEKP